MYKPKSGIGTLSAAMLGVGSMVGAGIFALLGETASIAGSAIWISFLVSGVIAMLSGYSLARLGARYPAAGGLIEYLVQGWGEGLFSGSLGVLLYLSGIVGMSLVARAFGAYGTAWLPAAWRPIATPALAVTVVLVLMLVNLDGARGVARVENLIVGIKFLVLTAFGIGGLVAADPGLLAPSTWPASGDVFSTVGLTFFAFSGYAVITNTAEDMEDPRRMLPRAMLLSIGMVLGIYLLVAFAVLGSLSPAQVAASKDYALAAAARPVLGAAGFVIMTLTALISTASSLNANLFATTNIGYQMAKDGELPAVFATPIAHSREGLLVSAVLVAVLAALLDLGAIAAVGAVAVLLVQAVAHAGHLRLLRETRAPAVLVVAALVGTAGAVVLALFRQATHSPRTIVYLGIVLVSAGLIEAFMRHRSGRVIRARTPLTITE